MADILIRGMEMPEPGQSILVAQNWDGSIYARLEPNGNFCPLVTLPEGHGKLGDLDTIVSFIDYYERPMDRNTSPFKALNAVRDFICNASNTIVPAEGGGDN